MGAFMRSIFAVIAGLLVSMVVLLAVEYAGSVLFPVPPDAMLTGAVDLIPLEAQITVVVGWALGAFVGPWLAGRLAGRAPLVHGLTVAVLLLAAGIVNLLSLPHPIWMWVAGIAAFTGLGILGARLAAKGQPAG
jgi:hypothetical protein